MLDIAVRSNLGLPDRGLFLCKEHIDAVTLEIRKHRPRIVFAPYWEDRHPDHVACSRIVQEAVFFNAKLRNYLPYTNAVTVEQCYFFYFINDVYEPDVVTDISAQMDIKKMAALGCYASQFTPAGDGNDYVATPLNAAYLDRVEARDRLLGQTGAVAYAEGFASKQPVPVNLF